MAEFDMLMDIQRNMASRIARENEMDNKVKLLTIIQSLVDAKTGKIAKEAVLIEAVQEGMLQAESEYLLKELVRDGTIRDVEGFVLLF